MHLSVHTSAVHQSSPTLHNMNSHHKTSSRARVADSCQTWWRQLQLAAAAFGVRVPTRQTLVQETGPGGVLIRGDIMIIINIMIAIIIIISIIIIMIIIAVITIIVTIIIIISIIISISSSSSSSSSSRSVVSVISSSLFIICHHCSSLLLSI